jgi:hypothetical protein
MPLDDAATQAPGLPLFIDGVVQTPSSEAPGQESSETGTQDSHGSENQIESGESSLLVTATQAVSPTPEELASSDGDSELEEGFEMYMGQSFLSGWSNRKKFYCEIDGRRYADFDKVKHKLSSL